MFETVKALQAEVRALRQELQQHKRARQVETAKPAKARSDWAAQSYQPGSVEVAQAPAWAGLYAGAAFGLGVSHTHGPNDSTTASFSSNFQPNFTFSTTFRSVSTQSIHETASPTAAAISGMIGYDYELGSNIVGGFQGDGTLWQRASNAKSLSLQTGFSEQNNQSRFLGILSANALTSPSEPVLTHSIVTNAPMWTVSALGKAGYKITPTTLLYAVGGGTYGSYEVSGGAPAGLFGLTGGLGVEAKVDAQWSLLLDYRFTHFFDGTGNTQFASVNTFPLGRAQGFNQFSLFASVNPVTINADLHHFRLGFARRFDSM